MSCKLFNKNNTGMIPMLPNLDDINIGLDSYCTYLLSHIMGKPTMWFPNRSDTNQAVQAQKMAKLEISDLRRRGIVLSVQRKQRR